MSYKFNPFTKKPDYYESGGVGLFEVDINGDLEPVTDSVNDQYYELDGNDDIMPKAA